MTSLTSLDLLIAATLAAQAHANQRRKGNGEPYINHPLRVARAAAHARLSDDAVVAALLHDVVEDTPVTMLDLAPHFSQRALVLVRLLTKDWPTGAPPEERAAKLPGYYARIINDPEALALKVLDRTDNVRDMARSAATHPTWARAYLVKTHAEIDLLAHLAPVGIAERYALAVTALTERPENGLNQGVLAI